MTAPNGKVSGSFRDPSGFMFTHDGQLYRQVNQKYQEDYDLLVRSGLYDQLNRSKTLVAHKEVCAVGLVNTFLILMIL